MKKLIFLTLLILTSNPSYAQEEAFDIDNFLDFSAETDNKQDTSEKPQKETRKNFISRYFEQKETQEKALKDAQQIMEQDPSTLDLRDSQKRLIEAGEQKRIQIKKTLEETGNAKRSDSGSSENTDIAREIKSISEKYTAAPFGLFWGINKEQTELLGFTLQSAERKDYTNVYSVINAKQKNDTFDMVTAIFGEQDKLWCIFAQSKPQPDTPQASNVLKLYETYYTALEKKYGNAKQYFTPAEYTEEIVTQSENKTSDSTTASAGSTPIGNDNFLKELQQGTAVLYATFENELLGITLGVSVDGEGKSYISIDYKNLKIMEQENQTKLDNLINDI